MGGKVWGCCLGIFDLAGGNGSPVYVGRARCHRQASLAYIPRGSVASRKVESSIPKLCLPLAIFLPLLATGPKFEAPFWSLITQSNGGTPSRPHTGLPGLYADRVRCLPQGRKFRGSIPKLCLPLAIFLPLLATEPNFEPLSHPLEPKAMDVLPRPTATTLLLTTKLCYCATALLLTLQIVPLAVPILLRYFSTANFTNCFISSTMCG